MRSESDGHLAAAAFPGLAVRESMRTGSLRPLVASVANRYHPDVDEFSRHAEEVRERSGWDRSFAERRVQRIRAVDGGFELDGDGPFAHVLVATGHPGLARPSEHPSAVHAYEPHEYASRVAIVGAGMAAATEWLNALAAGSEVVSIRRRPPLRRPLNVPRAALLEARPRVVPPHGDERARGALLRDLSAPSYPARAASGTSRSIGPWPTSQFRVSDASQTHRGRAGDLCDRLHARLAAKTRCSRTWSTAHALETYDRWIVLAPDSTVPALTDDARTLSLAGVAGQWAFPAADTIAGAKYAARAFLRRVCRTR